MKTPQPVHYFRLVSRALAIIIVVLDWLSGADYKGVIRLALRYLEQYGPLRACPLYPQLYPAFLRGRCLA